MCKTGRDVENPDGGSNTGCCVLFLRLATTAAAAEAQRQPKPIRRPSPFLFLFHSPLITSNAFDSILVSPLSACPPEYLTALRCYCCCCCCRVLFLDWHSARVWRREMEGQTACGQNHHHRVPPPSSAILFDSLFLSLICLQMGQKQNKTKVALFQAIVLYFTLDPQLYIYTTLVAVSFVETKFKMSSSRSSNGIQRKQFTK